MRLQQATAPMRLDPVGLHNSRQLERMWQRAQDNRLDRARAKMTHVIHEVELCIKAIATHAAYRTDGVSQRPDGHDMVRLCGTLPRSLQEELCAESETVVGNYTASTRGLEQKIAEVKVIRGQYPSTASGAQEDKETLEWLADQVNHKSYIFLLERHDPGSSAKYLHSGWLAEAIDQLKEFAGMGDVSSYFRYSSGTSYDALPPDVVLWGIVLSRFLYEHLFPVPMDDQRRATTRLLM